MEDVSSSIITLYPPIEAVVEPKRVSFGKTVSYKTKNGHVGVEKLRLENRN